MAIGRPAARYCPGLSLPANARRPPPPRRPASLSHRGGLRGKGELPLVQKRSTGGCFRCAGGCASISTTLPATTNARRWLTARCTTSPSPGMAARPTLTPRKPPRLSVSARACSRATLLPRACDARTLAFAPWLPRSSGSFPGLGVSSGCSPRRGPGEICRLMLHLGGFDWKVQHARVVSQDVALADLFVINRPHTVSRCPVRGRVCVF